MKTLPLKEYKKIVDSMPIMCVDIIIEKEGKYLLVKRANNPLKGKYWTPGGRILKGEKLEEAVIRKTMEETGLKVKIEKSVGYYEDFYKKNDLGLDYVHTVSIVYKAKWKKGNVKLDRQSNDFKWSKTVPIKLKKW